MQLNHCPKRRLVSTKGWRPQQQVSATPSPPITPRPGTNHDERIYDPENQTPCPIRQRCVNTQRVEHVLSTKRSEQDLNFAHVIKEAFESHRNVRVRKHGGERLALRNAARTHTLNINTPSECNQPTGQSSSGDVSHVPSPSGTCLDMSSS